jgi:hypothetical protein
MTVPKQHPADLEAEQAALARRIGLLRKLLASCERRLAEITPAPAAGTERKTRARPRRARR